MQKKIIIIGLLLSTSSLFCAAEKKSEPNRTTPALSQLATATPASPTWHNRPTKHARPESSHTHTSRLSKRQRHAKAREEQAAHIAHLNSLLTEKDHYIHQVLIHCNQLSQAVLERDAEIAHLSQTSGELQATIFLLQLQVQKTAYPQRKESIQGEDAHQ